MKTLHFTITVILLVIFGTTMVNAGKQLQLSDMRRTYNACMKAHGDTNGKDEQACGDAQERTHTEFLCNSDGQHCWLEVK